MSSDYIPEQNNLSSNEQFFRMVSQLENQGVFEDGGYLITSYEITDGYDVTPRPSGFEELEVTNGRRLVPPGHIALRGYELLPPKEN